MVEMYSISSKNFSGCYYLLYFSQRSWTNSFNRFCPEMRAVTLACYCLPGNSYHWYPVYCKALSLTLRRRGKTLNAEKLYVGAKFYSRHLVCSLARPNYETSRKRDDTVIKKKSSVKDSARQERFAISKSSSHYDNCNDNEDAALRRTTEQAWMSEGLPINACSCQAQETCVWFYKQNNSHIPAVCGDGRASSNHYRNKAVTVWPAKPKPFRSCCLAFVHLHHSTGPIVLA